MLHGRIAHKRMKTLRPSQQQLHRRHPHCAGFTKVQGLKSLLKTIRLHQPRKKKSHKLPLPCPTKKQFSRRTCLKILRLPQPPMKLMWSPPQRKKNAAKPLIPSLLFLSLLSVHSSTIMLSTGLRYRSQSQDCQGSQVLHQHLAPSKSMASGQTTHSSIAPGTPTQGKGYHLIGSGAIRSEAITPAFYTIKVASSHTSVLTLKQ